MSNETPIDFIDFVKSLKKSGCEFYIVGAYAMAVNGYSRATQDIDVWVRPSVSNAKKIVEALVDFGAPVAAHGISEIDFAVPGNIYQLGLPPVRIDILTSIDGVEFEDVKNDFVKGHLGDEEVVFIGLQTQIQNKRASNRLKDKADAQVLEAILEQKKKNG